MSKERVSATSVRNHVPCLCWRLEISANFFVGVATFTRRWKQSVSDNHFRLVSPLPVARQSIPSHPPHLEEFCEIILLGWSCEIVFAKTKKAKHVRVSVYKSVTGLQRHLLFLMLLVCFFSNPFTFFSSVKIILDSDLLAEQTHISHALRAREYL